MSDAHSVSSQDTGRAEFRAAWVATVENIDWPSRPGLPETQQRDEMKKLLDRAAALLLDAVVVQVRPSCDAIYPSTIEPWTEYLSGTTGTPPGKYDPLADWVREAHARRIEVHAWFNPFRARYSKAESEPSPDHVARTTPDLVHAYGKSLWLDPGDQRAHDLAMRVVTDVITRYDVDGVHIDDYFYPYPEDDLPFPDERTFAAYRDAGGSLGRDNWRRDNINRFVKRLYGEVKQHRDGMAMGISPFGIWRPGHPPQVEGFDPYEKLYADALLWLREGWCDYMVPQLYWPIEQTPQAFDVLLDWWIAQNVHGIGMYAGLFTMRTVSEERRWDVSQIVRQIELARTRPGCGGHVHFSATALLNGKVYNALQNLYAR